MSQENKEQQKQKAKGTKVTEAIIGAASNKITVATKALSDAVAKALEITKTLDENALKIADQEEKLNNLQTVYSNKNAQQKIDLELAYKANEKKFAEDYLKSHGMIAVNEADYDEVNNSLQEWEQKFSEKLRAEVSKAEAIANSKAEAARQLLEAQYQAKEAQNLAKIQNLESQLAFANKQAQSWENQLNAERQASIERSKSQSATVHVATPTGR